jgi:hypothetical protein
MLNNEQKLEIVNSRILVIDGTIYHLDLGIIEEQAKAVPAIDLINDLNNQRNESLLSLAVLESIRETLLA